MSDYVVRSTAQDKFHLKFSGYHNTRPLLQEGGANPKMTDLDMLLLASPGPSLPEEGLGGTPLKLEEERLPDGKMGGEVRGGAKTDFDYMLESPQKSVYTLRKGGNDGPRNPPNGAPSAHEPGHPRPCPPERDLSGPS